ncbi:hydroxyisourate hydrolase [soil metagenome]
MKSPITTHVLDTANGHPASGIRVTLEFEENGGWKEIANSETNSDGRITDWLPSDKPAKTGTYRVIFNVGDYFGKDDDFYSEIPILFHLNNPDEHYHIPLLLSPYGYTTYRGS